jgi:hypothetical protein
MEEHKWVTAYMDPEEESLFFNSVRVLGQKKTNLTEYSNREKGI